MCGRRRSRRCFRQCQALTRGSGIGDEKSDFFVAAKRVYGIVALVPRHLAIEHDRGVLPIAGREGLTRLTKARRSRPVGIAGFSSMMASWHGAPTLASRS